MNVNSRAINLFVSSTFSDMKAERDVLQQEVFPRLRQLSLSHGMRFQAIDLRWGISEEAGQDNRTMRLCVRELRRCQQNRPKPNFVILLGDRYGWRPLPELIPTDLFEPLAAQLHSADPAMFELLNQCYRLDDNIVPPHYELQPRRGHADWSDRIERPLLASLRQASQTLGLDPESVGVFLGPSATEQEIIEGALKVPDAARHVRAFFRTIDGLPDLPPADYVEAGEAAQSLIQLKDRIRGHIGDGNICRYHVPWRGDGIHTHDLNEFREEAWKLLKGVVEEQVMLLEGIPPDEQEEQAHRDFAKARSHLFVGRADPLARIAVYLRQGSGKPLAVIGPSGSGKSALLAMAAENVAREQAEQGAGKAEVICRFIGATPGSSDPVQLLSNLVGDIRKRYPNVPGKSAGQPTSSASNNIEPDPREDSEIPMEFNPLVSAFQQALLRPTLDRPLFIFIDALEQMTSIDQADSFAWLPLSLHPHVRLVVSAVLPDSGPALSSSLKTRLAPELQMVLAPLTMADGEQMLANWLKAAQRTLQPAQREAILGQFRIEGSPLWLRIAAEEASRLASWQAVPNFPFTTPALLEQVLTRLAREEEHGFKLVAGTLTYLACARHGLAEDELIELLSADSNVMEDFRRRSPNSPPVNSLPVAVWVRLLGDLGAYLSERRAQGTRLLGLHQHSFRNAVIARFLADPQQCCLGHHHLAEWFGRQDWFILPNATMPAAEADNLSCLPNERKASELPWHLYHRAKLEESGGDHWDECRALLTNLIWMEAKVRAGLVVELHGDFDLIWKELPDTAAENSTVKERRQRFSDWMQQRAAASKARFADDASSEHPPPPPIQSVVPWSNQVLAEERRRITENPSILDRIRQARNFTTAEGYALVRHGRTPGFLLQHLQNQGPGHFAYTEAGRILAKTKTRHFERQWIAPDSFQPRSAVQRSFWKHPGQFQGASISLDGDLILTWDLKTIKLWQADTGICRLFIQTEHMFICGVCLSPDHARLYSWDTGHLAEWDARTGLLLRKSQAPPVTGGFSGSPRRMMAMAPDGSNVATVENTFFESKCQNCIYLWNLQDLTITHGISIPRDKFGPFLGGINFPQTGHTLQVWGSGLLGEWDWKRNTFEFIIDGAVNPLPSAAGATPSVSVTLDGASAFASSGKSIWEISLRDRTVREVYTSEGERALLQAVSADGRLALVSDDRPGLGPCGPKSDTDVEVIDLREGKLIKLLKGARHSIFSAEFCADASCAVTVSAEEVLGWDIEEGSDWISSRQAREVTGILRVAKSDLAVSAGKDSSLFMWRLWSGRRTKLHQSLANPIAGWVAADANLVLVADPYGRLGKLDLKRGPMVETEDHLFYWGLNVQLSDDGKVSFPTKEGPGFCFDSRMEDSQSGEFTAEPVLRPACPGVTLEWALKAFGITSSIDGKLEGNSLALSGSGHVLMGTAYGHLLLWDIQKGKILRRMSCFGQEAIVHLDSCGHDRAFSVGNDLKMRLRDDRGQRVRKDPHDGKVVVQDQSNEGTVYSANMVGYVNLKDGRTALLNAGGQTFRIWDLRRGLCLAEFDDHAGGRQGVAFARSSMLALTAAADRSVRVWDLSSGVCLQTFSTGPSEISGVAISEDGRCIATAHADGSAKVWSAEGHLLRLLPSLSPGKSAVYFDGEGTRAITICNAGCVALWDVPTAELLAVYQTEAVPTSHDVANGLDRLCIGCRDGAVLFLELKHLPSAGTWPEALPAFHLPSYWRRLMVPLTARGKSAIALAKGFRSAFSQKKKMRLAMLVSAVVGLPGFFFPYGLWLTGICWCVGFSVAGVLLLAAIGLFCPAPCPKCQATGVIAAYRRFACPKCRHTETWGKISEPP